MKLSILIPAYNVQEELSRCLESILSQPVDSAEFEVIIVDDGSTDHTSELLQRYAAQYTNVRAVAQPNAGVSAARNHALQLAQGDFVTYVDADDTLTPGSLVQVMQHLTHARHDITVCQSHCNGREHYRWSHIFDEDKDYAPIELLRQGYIRGSVCGVLFSRQFVHRCHISFLEGVSLGEDSQFGLEALAHAHGVCFKPIPLYQVVGRPTSASRVFTPQRIQREILDVKRIFEHIRSIETSLAHSAYIPYMRYLPMSNMVSHLLLTPHVGLRCLLQSGLSAYCNDIVPASGLTFMSGKMKLLRFSLPLYYLTVLVKTSLSSIFHK